MDLQREAQGKRFEATWGSVFQPWWLAVLAAWFVLWTWWNFSVQIDTEPVWHLGGMAWGVISLVWIWWYQTEPLRGSKVGAVLTAIFAARAAQARHQGRQVREAEAVRWAGIAEDQRRDAERFSQQPATTRAAARWVAFRTPGSAD